MNVIEVVFFPEAGSRPGGRPTFLCFAKERRPCCLRHLTSLCFTRLGLTPSPSGGGLGWGHAALDEARLCSERRRAPIPAFPREGKEQCIRPRCPMSCLSPSPSGGGLGWGHAALFEALPCSERRRAPIPAFPREGKEQCIRPRCRMTCLSPSPSGGGLGWGHAALDEARLCSERRRAPIPAFPREGKEQCIRPGVPCLVFLPPLPGEGWGGGTVAERSNGPIAKPSKAMACSVSTPSGCAEERSVSRIRARSCLSEASSARPRETRAPQVAP
jgi:hypothetical protein